MTTTPTAPSPSLDTEFLFEIRIPLAPPITVGPGPDGWRVIRLAESGRFEGPRLRGEVIPMSGGDYVRRRGDGISAIDVRLCLATDDGARVLMTYQGRFDPGTESREYALDFAKPDDPADADRYYFRTNPLFETGDERYAWLNRVVAVGKGRTGDGGVNYEIFEVK